MFALKAIVTRGWITPSSHLSTKKLITGVAARYTCDESFLAEIELSTNRERPESIYAATLSKVAMSIEWFFSTFTAFCFFALRVTAFNPSFFR